MTKLLLLAFMALAGTAFALPATTGPLLIQKNLGEIAANGAAAQAIAQVNLGFFGTPASSTATCVQGQIVFDASYVYTCVATNTWRRAATSSF